MVSPAVFSAGGALLGAGMSYFGQNSANRSNRQIAREQMQFQAEQTQQQMDFQERMSNTAYQRAISDMEAAGLNPILAYNMGGASSPPGAAAAGASQTMRNTMSGAVSSALDARRMFAEVRNLDAQNKNLDVQNENLRKLTQEIESRSRLNNASAQSVEYTLPGKKIESDLDKAAGSVPSFSLKWLRRLFGSLLGRE